MLTFFQLIYKTNFLSVIVFPDKYSHRLHILLKKASCRQRSSQNDATEY